jgi:hypothetical protein
MASNSKLLTSEKADLKDFKKSMPKNMAFEQSGPVTVLVRVMTNCVHVSTALASPNEKKVRAKVGQYRAAERMFENIYVSLPRPDLYPDYGQSDAEAQAEYFASLFN